MTRLASLASAAFVLAALPLPGAGATPAPSLPAARVRIVRPGSPEGTLLAPATVVAARRATISTRVAAAVRDVHVREGQRVAAGQVLVSLSDADVRASLAAAETALQAAAVHERRIRALAAERAATPAELELAQAQRAQAEAQVAAARATLGYTELRAPFAATVQARRIDPGDLVGPGQPLLELEGDALELVATLSEAEARGVAVGATVRFQAGAARGEATVAALTPGGDPVTRRRTVRAKVGRVDGELRTGAFARLELPAAGATAAGTLWIPRTALVARGDLTGVFVAAEGMAELRWLSIGERAGDHVAVRAGLAPGEAVVDAPGALRDGAAVEVLP
jgi:RND family efflux transporter MFP subunit